ncbi:MAG: ABC transporter ATP-binding protein [Cyanophyceae cyanobacterium]
MDWMIDARDLTKRFDRHIAVDGINLTIAPGEVYGLIGPNGAGKTTLIRMLAAVDTPTLGEVYINGFAVGDRRQRQHIARSIGFLPDDFPVYDDLLVRDYLEYFGRLYGLHGLALEGRIYDVLTLVQLDQKRDAVIGTLSRGMKQRLSLARTVLHEPSLLLLDEPVSGLDPIARQEFRQIIRSLHAAGMTVLISSHVLSDLAELCTCVGIMETGNLVASAPLANLYDQFSGQTLHLGVLERLDDLERLLECHALTDSLAVDRDRQTMTARFKGSDRDRAALLQDIVAAAIPLVEFRCDRDNLEQIFLKLDRRQTS